MPEIPVVIPIPAPGSIWQHWKGGTYRVAVIASREDDGREQVVYQSMRDGRVFVRDLDSWHSLITLPGGQQRPRFAHVPQEGDET